MNIRNVFDYFKEQDFEKMEEFERIIYPLYLGYGIFIALVRCADETFRQVIWDHVYHCLGMFIPPDLEKEHLDAELKKD